MYPIPPSYKWDEESERTVLDYEMIEKYVTYLYDQGARIFMTTVGTSQFGLMRWNECADLNIVVAEQVAKYPNAVFIAGIPGGEALRQFVHAKVRTHNLVAWLVDYPERYYNDEDILDFYKEVLDRWQHPVWVHGVPIRKGVGGTYFWSPELLGKLRDMGVTGVKEESLERFPLVRPIADLAEDYFTVCVAGGSGYRFKLIQEAKNFNRCTYLAGVGSFFPDIEEKIFRAIRQGDAPSTRELLTTFEFPLMSMAGNYGWHQVMRGGLISMNLLGEVQRPPFKIANSGVSEHSAGAIAVEALARKRDQWLKSSSLDLV